MTRYSACLFIGRGRTTSAREAQSTYMDAAYLFNKGENYMSYNFLGAHPYEDENGKKQRIYLTDIAPDNRGVTIGSGFVPRYILRAAPKRSLSYFI